MIVLGLTGSIGMGKTTTAGLFASQGATIYDTDKAVHDLYRAGGLAGSRLREGFPEAVSPDGEVSRAALKAILAADPGRLVEIEAQMFPLLRVHLNAFLDEARAQGKEVVVLDIPLLYETGADGNVDAVVVATAPAETQKARILARGLSLELFAVLSARQIDDAEKRRRADFLVFTDKGLEAAAQQVALILDTIRPHEAAAGYQLGKAPPGSPKATSSEYKETDT